MSDEEPKAYRQVPGNEAAVVFIHGFSGNITATWGEFPAFVAQHGAFAGWDIWCLGYASNLRVDVVGLWSANPDITKISRLLRANASDGQLKPYKSLALIAHSMGGLVAQQALIDDPSLRRRVSHLVLFGTPSGGLSKARLVQLFKPQLRDMSRGGVFIDTLRTRWTDAF